MEKYYGSPEIEIIHFDFDDVITTSDTGDGISLPGTPSDDTDD